MKFLYKYGTRPSEIRRARKELFFRIGLAGAVLLFFAVVILVTRYQPRLEKSTYENHEISGSQDNSGSQVSLASLRGQVDAMMQDYHERVDNGMDPMEGIDLLDKAIALQNKVIGSRTSSIAPLGDVDRLREIQKIKHETMGNYLIAQSNRQENQAREAFDRGDFAEAEQLLTRAINVQRQINQQYPLSTNRDDSRLQQLANKLLEWQTRPIAEKADRLKEEAFRLAAEGNYAEARLAIRTALNEQKSLAGQYRQSRYVSPQRMRSFEAAVIEIDTAEDVRRVQQLVQETETSLDKGNYQPALATAAEAEVLQNGILKHFRDPPEEQAKLLTRIQILKDTAASGPAFERIQTLRSATVAALKARDIKSFQEQVAEWSRETIVFSRRYKSSRYLGDLDMDEVSYLYKMREEAAAIMEMVQNDLVPLPGSDHLLLYRKEVPQALYESVTGSNPSSAKDSLKPVDSVTWKEAVEFTILLGKVLARPVALPDRSMYLSALGEPDLLAAQAEAWSSENSNRLVQPCGQRPANAAGFHDLLGNVAEWLATGSPDKPDRVMAIGGSARDSSARLATIPEDWRPPDERNRFIGFRFIVDTQDDSE